MSNTPEPTPFFSRRSVRISLGISIGALLVMGLGSWYVLGAGSHPLTVSNALDRFRSSEGKTPGTTVTSTSPSPSPSGSNAPHPGARSTTNPGLGATVPRSPSRRPPPDGVYVYATQGGEQTDALSGQKHQYPSQTTITLTHAGCGSVARWQPLSERWDETEACQTTRGVTLRRYSMYHQFFHKGVREDFACGSDAVVMPWNQVAGDHWTFVCHSSGTTLDMAVRVVGFEMVDVGGRSIRAVHIRYDGRASGNDSGTETQDRWLTPDEGLFLRIVSSADIQTSTPFGRAHYLESYRIDLTSTSPER